MRSELLSYYENELTSLRTSGSEFAQKYPKIASRLQLEPTKCEDPHVERLLEAFAFLAARIQLKLDDEFPLITESLLEVLYPDFLKPIPSMSIAEFVVDSQSGAVTSAVEIARGTKLYSKAVNGVPCKFRTAYDTVLSPITVTSAEWRGPERLPVGVARADCAGAIRVQLRGPRGVPLRDLGVDRLRFYLDGDNTLVHMIYELLICNLLQVTVRAKNRTDLPTSAVSAVGFEPNEGVLAFSQRTLVAYRLLQEYFAFPEKFLFFDLSGCEKAWIECVATDEVEVYFLLSAVPGSDWQQRLELGIAARTFRLNCTPVINLFEQTCEPIQLDGKRYEYAIVPDIRRSWGTEIHSIDRVTISSNNSDDYVECRPFYSPQRETAATDDKAERFWIASRKPSNKPQDNGSDVFISFVDRSGNTRVTDGETVTVRCTCTNRDLPSRLPFGAGGTDFELDGNAPVTRILALRKPTPSLRPPDGPGSLWNLISHLSLNYLSLVGDGKAALKGLLTLCDYSRTASTRRVLEGITDIGSEPHFAGLMSDHGLSFVRGVRVALELDEEQFVGGGAYLFAAVLERFFAQYCSMNSFSQLTVRTRQRREGLRQWQPRAGNRILL